MTSSSIDTCPFCEAEIGLQAKKCRHCGEWVSRSCETCGTPLRGEWAARGLCAECRGRRQVPAIPDVPVAVAKRKSRGLAAFTAFFFGSVGLHKFYLGNYLAGFVYLVFCWTLIPAIAGLFTGIKFAVMDDVDFHSRYSG